MTRLWSEGEAIQVHVNHRGQPRHFTWHKRRHHIQHIQQCWQVDTDWWDAQGRIWRTYVAVTTTDQGLYVLYQDRLTDRWYLSKAYD